MAQLCRVFSGEAMMSAYNGNFGFGLPTPDMSPDWLAPVSQQQLQWPKWGSYFESKGRDGGNGVADLGAWERP